MALLLTPTLLNSIDWLDKCPKTWKKSAYQGLLDMLNRVWAPTPAIERGINFEKEICHGENPLQVIEKIDPNITDKFKEAYNRIHAEGHSFQAKSKKFFIIDDKEFLLYGRIDVDFANKAPIIDIKTTGNYRGRDSYLEGWQHKCYCLCTRNPDFDYIVYEFDAMGLLVDIHTISYHVEDFAALEKEIVEKLQKVVAFLKSDEKLKKAYLNKFNRYN